MLRHRADIRTLFFNSLYFLFVGLAWRFAPLNLWAFPFVVVICFTAFQGAVVTHNTVHSPMFHQKWMNKIYQIVLSQIYGHPVSTYVPGHNLSHHKHTQTRKDVMRTTKSRFRLNVFNLCFFMPTVVPSIMRADTLYLKAMYRRHPVWFHQMLVELIVLWGLTATFLILDWKRTLLFWMLPHLYAQWGIITINYFQHDGCDGDSEFNHSRNFIDPFFNWWFFNNGFHAIHHDFPNLHWSATPEAYRNRYAGNIHPNLEESSMLKFLWRTFALNQRRRYDGSEWELPEEGPDEDWIPRPTETRNDLGAEPLEPQIW